MASVQDISKYSAKELFALAVQQEILEVEQSRTEVRNAWLEEQNKLIVENPGVLLELLNELWEREHPVKVVNTRKTRKTIKQLPTGELCQARVFRGGVGGQCGSRQKCGILCNKHSEEKRNYNGLGYGLITEIRPTTWGEIGGKIPLGEVKGENIHWADIDKVGWQRWIEVRNNK